MMDARFDSTTMSASFDEVEMGFKERGE